MSYESDCGAVNGLSNLRAGHHFQAHRIIDVVHCAIDALDLELGDVFVGRSPTVKYGPDVVSGDERCVLELSWQCVTLHVSVHFLITCDRVKSHIWVQGRFLLEGPCANIKYQLPQSFEELLIDFGILIEEML